MMMMMLMMILMILLLIVLCYSYNPHSIINRYRKTSLCLSSLPYNPYDDDNNDIRKLIENEKNNIINDNISTIDMKNELKKFSRGQGIVDKMTLIEELARLRVKNRINDKQTNDAITNDREDKAIRLINEIHKINTNYSDKEIVQELRVRKVQFDVFAPRNQLTRILALARLEMLSSNNNSKSNEINDNDDDDTDDKLLEDAVLLFQNFTNLGKSTVDVTLQTITNISNDIKTKYDSTITSTNLNVNNDITTKTNDDNNDNDKIFTKIVNNLGLTEVEQNAKKYLNDNDENFDVKMKKRLILSTKELQSLEKLLKQENTFDDIVKLARTKSRSEISQLLEFLGIDVPKFAPLSVLSSLLADCIMTEKVLHEGLQPNTKLTKEDISGEPSVIKTPVRPIGTISSHINPNKRKYNISNIDSYDPEKDILSEIFTAILNIDPVDVIEKFVPKNTEIFSRTSSSIKSFFSSTTMKWIIKTLAVLSQFIKQLVLKFASWCIGDFYLSPTNCVILVTFICMITRKGLLYFVGSFLCIRLLRVLFSSLTDDKINNEKNREQPSASFT